jgi:hypothetical protein
MAFQQEIKMKNRLTVLILCFFALINVANAGSYEEAIAEWKSYQDVANWLDTNFSFDKDRQKQISILLKKEGPSGVLVRNPATLYEGNKSGYCADSANFAMKSLNKIDPAYNARWVYIKNDKGSPNHWVTAFDLDKKLYIMDFGTGEKWQEMQGIHGPYDSLDEYRDYLASLRLSGFKAGEVQFMDMPGQED